MLEEILAYALPTLQTGVMATVTWLFANLARLIAERVKSEAARDILERLNETVLDVVLELEQTMVPMLKKMLDPDSDGGVKLTAKEQDELKQEAVTRIKALLGPTGIRRLLRVLGVTDEADAAVETFLVTKIEAAIRKLKG